MKPQATPYDSPWTLQQRVRMLVWEYAWLLLCQWTPKPLNRWRLFILRLFGATLHGKPFVHQRARITLPWNLIMHDHACLGDRAHAYSLDKIEIHEGATVAQEAYLCTGTHDFGHPALPLRTAPIIVSARAFIGARAFVLPGVTIGEGAVIGACSVVPHSTGPRVIMAGNPARTLRKSTIEAVTGEKQPMVESSPSHKSSFILAIPWKLAFGALLLALAYLSFKPNPEIQGTIAMPASLGAWFDLHDDWKNLVGFGTMGFAGFMAWPNGLALGLELRLWQRRVLLGLAMCLVILFMELVQIPIPRRWFDVKDLIAGSLGIALSWPLSFWLQRMVGTAPLSGHR